MIAFCLESEENTYSQEKTFQFAEFTSTLYKVEILSLYLY